MNKKEKMSPGPIHLYDVYYINIDINISVYALECIGVGF